MYKYTPQGRPLGRQIRGTGVLSEETRLGVAGAARADLRGWGGAPVLEAEGERLRIDGYVHQMEILHRWHAMGEARELPDVLEQIRPLPRLARDVPVDRALNTFAASGRRIALVVTEEVAGESGPLPREAILGLVSVNDLLERISHEVVR